MLERDAGAGRVARLGTSAGQSCDFVPYWLPWSRCGLGVPPSSLLGAVDRRPVHAVL